MDEGACVCLCMCVCVIPALSLGETKHRRVSCSVGQILRSERPAGPDPTGTLQQGPGPVKPEEPVETSEHAGRDHYRFLYIHYIRLYAHLFNFEGLKTFLLPFIKLNFGLFIHISLLSHIYSVLLNICSCFILQLLLTPRMNHVESHCFPYREFSD